MPDDNGKKDTNDVKEPTGFTKRERRVVEEKFGIRFGSDEAPLEYVITKEKLAAIEASALRKLRKGADPCCSLCGRSQKEVSQLFTGQNGSICNKCLEDRI